MSRVPAMLAVILVAGCTAAGARPAADSTAPAPEDRSFGIVPPSPTTAAAAGDITLAFAGDVHFAERVQSRLTHHPHDVLGPIGKTLAAADISMVNFESAVTDRGAPEPKQFHFRAPPAALTALRAQGIEVVTMANNHGADYGPVGLKDSLAAIKATGMPVVGIGANSAQAYSPFLRSVRGVRIAIIGASQIHDRTTAAWTAGASSPGIASALAVDRLVAAVRAARARSDVVVVYLHWGTEGHACPNSEQSNLSRQLVIAGADAVVGTHAHLLLGGGWQGRAYVDYGLGNFLWWRDNAYSNDTGVLTLRVHAHRVVGAALTPARIDGEGVPLPATGAEATRIQAKFAQLRGCTGLSAAPAS